MVQFEQMTCVSAEYESNDRWMDGGIIGHWICERRFKLNILISLAIIITFCVS